MLLRARCCGRQDNIGSQLCCMSLPWCFFQCSSGLASRSFAPRWRIQRGRERERDTNAEMILLFIDPIYHINTHIYIIYIHVYIYIFPLLPAEILRPPRPSHPSRLSPLRAPERPAGNSPILLVSEVSGTDAHTQ